MRLTLVLVADVPAHAREAFAVYEAAVLPLLPRHRGRLERRLRTADGGAEVHVVSFADAAGWAAYRADPERLAVPRPDGVGQRLLEVTDVEG